MKIKPRTQKVLLIFGVSGFIGTNFGQYLKENMLEADLKVIGVVSRERDVLFVGIHHLEVVDVLDTSAVRLLLHKFKPNYIVNFIGLFGKASYQELIQTNVEISHNILQAIVDISALKTRLLFIGSAAEYGAVKVSPVSEQYESKPVSMYGLSKVFQTELVRFYHHTHEVQAIIARTFNLTGVGISPSLSVGSFQNQIETAEDGGIIKVGSLDSVRDFLDVETAVAMYMSLLLYGKAGEVYNVCSGKPTRIGDLLDNMIVRSGKRLALEVSPSKVYGNDVQQIYGDRGKLDELLSRASED